MNDKIFLLAFGETIPLGDTFPIFYEWIPEASRFTPGREPSVIRWGDKTLGMLVCYEDILPRFANEVMALEPDVLINITNDAWFGRTGEPYLHMMLAAMRAVEHRRTLMKGRTLYSRIGEAFGHGCVAWAFLVLVVARLRRRRT
jgi:apolipoprotein N-acyltransferase